MAFCGSTGWLPHHHENKSRLCTAANVFTKGGSGKIYTQQMPGQQLRHPQQRGEQRQAEQELEQHGSNVPRRSQKEKDWHSQGLQGVFLGNQNEITRTRASGCESSSASEGAAGHRSSLRYICSFLWFLLLQGRLLIFCGDAVSGVVLPVEARHATSAPVLASPLEEATAVDEGSTFVSALSGGARDQSSPRSVESSVSAENLQDAKASPPPSGEEQYEFSWHGSRILALGDLHGDLLNCMLLLCAAGLVDPVTHSWRGGDALLIQTGDINDRGPQGVATLDFLARLSTEARAAGGAVVQLLGNHDVMNVCGDFRYAHAAETAQLGGILGRRAAFHPTHGRYGRMLSSFSVAVKVNGVVFSHAGVLHNFASWGLPALTRHLRQELLNDCELSRLAAADAAAGARDGAAVAVSGADGPLWTRSFTLGPISRICKEVERTLRILQAQKMVVGHTVQESGHIESYCHGQLIAIDTGISRYVSNQPTMLEINQGNFYEWDIRPPPRGESVAEALTTAAQKAVKRPLGIPPLKIATLDPTEKKTSSEGPRVTVPFQESFSSLRGDEL